MDLKNVKLLECTIIFEHDSQCLTNKTLIFIYYIKYLQFKNNLKTLIL